MCREELLIDLVHFRNTLRISLPRVLVLLLLLGFLGEKSSMSMSTSKSKMMFSRRMGELAIRERT